MKALSFKQPWAWLVCAGIKNVDNRTWPIRTGLPRRIYVHAGKKFDESAWARFARLVDAELWRKLHKEDFYQNLPRGAIVGQVDIIDCRYRYGDERAELYSPWHEIGMYGFVLANPVLYEMPIGCKGMLGFFEPDIKEFYGMRYPFKECARPKLRPLGYSCNDCSVNRFCEANDKAKG